MRGFTLIEILIAIAITTLSAAYVTSFTLDLSDFGVNLGNRLETERELEATLRTMISEVRSMGPGGNGAYTIAAATPTSLTFFSDIDVDGVFEQVRYFLQDGVIKKGVTEPTATEPVTYPSANEVLSDLVHYVTSTSIFSYYPAGHPDITAPLASPVSVADIRLVRVMVTTDKDSEEPPSPTTLGITINIRNLRGDI